MTNNKKLFLGNWRCVVPLPVERTVESLANSLEGEEKSEWLIQDSSPIEHLGPFSGKAEWII